MLQFNRAPTDSCFESFIDEALSFALNKINTPDSHFAA